ncbi:glycosyltransferase family 2 protein [Candidatus Nomurabacteria bacterium]|nr:glycosyltransferase family 2 protein [Candidatus Nomurabacteria bacterium]
MKLDLSIITVCTNDKDRILEVLESTFSGTKDVTFEYIVSDNGSMDGSVEAIKEKFPQVKIVENGENVGFGAANNAGYSLAKGEYLLLLNPDMRIKPGSLKTILQWARKHTEVGVVSPKLIDQNGKLQENAKPRRFPGFMDQAAIVLKLPHIFPHILDTYLYKDFDPSKEQEVDSVRGSFMLIKKEILDTLGWAFDPRYFIWFEDVDTCREVQRLGYKVMYTPIIECVDYVGQTFKRLPTLQKQKWFTASMVKYFRKWEPWYKWMPIALLRPVGIALAWGNDVILKLKK